MNINVISVVEFKKLWVLKRKMFDNNKHDRKKTLNFVNTIGDSSSKIGQDFRK